MTYGFAEFGIPERLPSSFPEGVPLLDRHTGSEWPPPGKIAGAITVVGRPLRSFARDKRSSKGRKRVSGPSTPSLTAPTRPRGPKTSDVGAFALLAALVGVEDPLAHAEGG